MKNKKKLETSKVILLISFITTIVLTLIVIIGTFLSFEMSNITTLASLSWAELGTAVGFYSNKAKKENALKIIKDMPDELKEQIDINQLMI